MYPPEVGLRAEDSILEQLASQSRETLAQLKTGGVVGDGVVLQVATTGNGWDEALVAADWKDGDLLAVGTRLWAGSRTCSLVRLKDPAAQPRPRAGAAGLTFARKR